MSEFSQWVPAGGQVFGLGLKRDILVLAGGV